MKQPRSGVRIKPTAQAAGTATRQFTLDQRAAGLLLHPTSLPGPHGCGDLGPAAYRFVDFLAAGGQRWWQMLPVGPVGPAGSPYSSPSAFAGSPLLVGLELLHRDGLLTRDEIEPAGGLSARQVSYNAVQRYREKRLRIASERFLSRRRAKRAAFEHFCDAHKSWLDDFALFTALARATGTADWCNWPAGGRRRMRSAAARELDDEIRHQKLVQFLFDRQWAALRKYCHSRGVGLFGDIPIFVIHESADVWAHPRLFELNRDGRPTVVSGVPPDYFSRTGQLWGHPLYRWKAHQRDGFAWWIERFRAAAERFDAVRIDHFLGFNRCWAVPAGHRTAARGTWRASPGAALLERVTSALGRELRIANSEERIRRRKGAAPDSSFVTRPSSFVTRPSSLSIVAEDLGAVVPEAVALRERFGFPGMRILQFAFGDGVRYDQPHNYVRNCVAYTGTHDNETFVGWFRGLRRDRRRGRDGLTVAQRALRYLDGDAREIHWQALRTLYMSPANLVMCPVQDVLGLDNRARMNTPATVGRNWRWRLAEGALRPEHAGRLAELVETYERGKNDE